jgi:transposase
MANPLLIPDDLWSKLPPDAQAAIAALFLAMQQRTTDLETRVNDLEARLKLNSTNSHKPPSSDFIGAKRKPPAPPTGKRRGGQPKHRKAHRALVPPEKVRETFTCKPTHCRRCGHGLLGDDLTPLIHQVAESPKVEPFVDEYRLHRLACPDCGATTCATLPPGVPTLRFGPYLQAVLTVFAGAYRLSKRQIRQLSADLFGLSISTGMISKLERRSAEILEAPHNELAISVHSANAANIDETSWRQDRRKAWLWATVTRIATVFTIAGHRSGAVARALSGSAPDQVVSGDRFGASEWIAARWRQICWAHLRRDFQAMIDRGGEGKPIGERLLKRSHRLFHDWHRVRDGTLDWETFGQRMTRLRREVRQALWEGSKCGGAKTSATCFEILKVEEGLWTFARVKGIEPTNNAAERAPRFAVIWRRISGGTESQRGGRFVERTLSVVATCRQQGRNVLEYLTSCFEADHQGQPIPSLLPTSQPTTKAA